MNWGKAKNFTIAFLALLNIVLGAQTILGRRVHRLDAAQLRNIRAVLENANIRLDTPIPVSYSPMRQMALARCDYDYDALAGLFFDAPEEAVRSDEPDKIVFRADAATLSVQNNGYVAFYNPGGMGETASFDESSAKALCDGFIEEMSVSMQGLEFDNCVYEQEDGGFRIDYRQVYGNTVIYSNYVSFLVTGGGITQMDCYYGKPLGYTGASMNICPPDVALLEFMEGITGYYGNDDYSVTVTRIDIVYYQEGYSVPYYETFNATPWYRITYFDGPDETSSLLNAYR